MRILAIDPSTTRMGFADATGTWAVTAAGTRQQRLGRMLEHLLDAPNRGDVPDVVAYYTPFARGLDATRCQWGVAALIEARFAAFSAVMDVREAAVRAWAGIAAPKGMPKGKQRVFLKAATREFVGAGPELSEDECDALLLLKYVEANIKEV